MCVPIKKVHIDQTLNDVFDVSEGGGVRNVDNLGEGFICDAVIFFGKTASQDGVYCGDRDLKSL